MIGVRKFTSCFKSVTCILALIAVAPLAGCERKEKLLDVETSEGEVEVERNIDTGRVDVEVNEN